MRSGRIQIRRFLLIKAALLVTLTVVMSTPAAAAESAYLYNLATFTGDITSLGVRLAVDDRHGEVYVADNSTRAVRIFNEAGMEVYRFGDDDRLGVLRDLTVLPDGDILLLSYPTPFDGPVLLRCDYRGEPRQQISIKGVPSEWSNFRPTRMVLRGERLYLADTGQMLVAEADLHGEVVAHYDLAKQVKIDASSAGLGGFTVDFQGRMVFTVPVKFLVGILSPDGTFEAFGQSGSTAGKFGVVAGVDVDAEGRIYVVDTLRCKVIVFDSEYTFLDELGGRSYRPGGLISPDMVVVAGDGKLFVSQRARRGVGVFRFDG